MSDKKIHTLVDAFADELPPLDHPDALLHDALETGLVTQPELDDVIDSYLDRNVDYDPETGSMQLVAEPRKLGDDLRAYRQRPATGLARAAKELGVSTETYMQLEALRLQNGPGDVQTNAAAIAKAAPGVRVAAARMFLQRVRAFLDAGKGGHGDGEMKMAARGVPKPRA